MSRTVDPSTAGRRGCLPARLRSLGAA